MALRTAPIMAITNAPPTPPPTKSLTMPPISNPPAAAAASGAAAPPSTAIRIWPTTPPPTAPPMASPALPMLRSFRALPAAVPPIAPASTAGRNPLRYEGGDRALAAYRRALRFLEFDMSGRNRAAVEVPIHFRHRETGAPFESTKANFWTLEDGWPVTLTAYHDRADTGLRRGAYWRPPGVRRSRSPLPHP